MSAITTVNKKTPLVSQEHKSIKSETSIDKVKLIGGATLGLIGLSAEILSKVVSPDFSILGQLSL